MNQDITHFAKTRYSAKAFDANKKISAEDIEKVKELLKFSPSSVNSQPWHFIIASTDNAKAKIAKATELYPFNTKAILDASHVIIFCSRSELTEKYLFEILEKEEKDGRFPNEALKEQTHGARSFFINLHKDEIKDVEHWVDKQVYLNAGAFMLGVAALEIDALPMEGIQPDVLDKEFGLSEKGYRGLIVLPIGYSKKENDYNANTPKSRLDYSQILTEI